MKYAMTGTQPITLEDGRVILPGADEFEAEMSPSRAEWFTRVGAIKAKPATRRAADDQGPPALPGQEEKPWR